MSKKRGVLSACALLGGAVLLAVYGAGFSWRQVSLGVTALFFCAAAHELLKRALFKDFRRMQFRIWLGNLRGAIRAAEIYSEEDIDAAMNLIFSEMPGNGSIVFTWLEPRLFYMNATNKFLGEPALSIALPAFGKRAEDLPSHSPDQIRLAWNAKGYDLVLEKAAPLSTCPKEVVLLSLPYKFLWAFQDNEELWINERRAREILVSYTGMKYYEDSELTSVWEYQSEFGTLRWSFL